MTFMPGLTAVNGQPVVRLAPPASVANSADPFMPGRFMTLTERDMIVFPGIGILNCTSTVLL